MAKINPFQDYYLPVGETFMGIPIEGRDGIAENTIVVTGSYGRSTLSRLFNQNLSNVIINQHGLHYL